jgi:hypothetical protein
MLARDEHCSSYGIFVNYSHKFPITLSLINNTPLKQFLRHSLRIVVPAMNLIKFGQIGQLKKSNHLGSVKSVCFCCQSL